MLLVLFLYPFPRASADLIIFGDSLADTGNLFLASGGVAGPLFSPTPGAFPPRFPTPPFYQGRASNGPLWIELLAARLNEPNVLPHLVGGTNYAYIGATTGPQTQSPFGVPDLTAQVQIYLASSPVPGKDDFFMVWGGANDFFFGQNDPQVSASNIVDQIEILAAAGARRFIVPNLPLLGETPGGRLAGGAGLNYLSMNFNQILDKQLDDLPGTFDITIYEVDVASTF